jgi:hypothetical protein
MWLLSLSICSKEISLRVVDGTPSSSICVHHPNEHAAKSGMKPVDRTPQPLIVSYVLAVAVAGCWVNMLAIRQGQEPY